MPPPVIRTFRFADDDRVPNHPRLPVLLLAGAFPPDGHASADAFAAHIEATYRRHGWGGTWRWGVYPFTHYHSTAHEVLACFAGHARLQLGGDGGAAVELTPGDVVVLPAGTGHRNLGATDDFQVVGGYPPGQDADLIRADEADAASTEAARERIDDVPRPATDPVFGADGPLRHHWAR